MTIRERIEMIEKSPAASFWLKDALKTALNRDCVDAANDAQAVLLWLGY